MLVKICYKCGMEKPLSEFYKNHTKKLGISSNCKLCCDMKVREIRLRSRLKTQEFKWICNNGHINILDYDPTIDKRKWDYRECVVCKSSF